MKVLYALFIFIAISTTGFSQVQSSCAPVPALRKLYAGDVADIAVQRLYQLHSPDTALIEIPQTCQDTILNAFAAICNLGGQLEADSVFRNYCVHRAPQQAWMKQWISVKVDTNYAWAMQWFLGNKVSGNAALDQFMSLHSVYLSGYFCEPWAPEFMNNVATLTARTPINMKAFGDSLLKFKGVLYYEFGHSYGDGDHISYSTDSVARLTFIAGWGDCPSGCTSWKVWKYRVALNTCKVGLDTIYAGGSHEKPYLPNCNMQPVLVTNNAVSNEVAIYPNPANETLHISRKASAHSAYSILDATGHMLLSGSITNASIDISSLSFGFYTILLFDPAGRTVVRKFIRQ